VPVLSKVRSPTGRPTLDLVAGPKQSKLLGDQSNDHFHGTRPSVFDISTIPMEISSAQLQNYDARRLLHHYDQVVAPNMAWADSRDNPWRHIIIPLALQSPPLLSSILAFAAKHINAITFSKSGESASSVSDSLSTTHQQQAIKLLAQEVHEFSKTDISHSALAMNKNVNWNRSNAILAAMLVLCNVETVWPGILTPFRLDSSTDTISLVLQTLRCGKFT
jgi:hypothetical protein